ncbi:uncharacterized protein K02A2.6-like [Liolophura sinensis]|uniref:uncharacterized protein K02A2.6-like n=1 Tax=Liolophura sinensis TaxID=3198878 RepID=UPI0031581479
MKLPVQLYRPYFDIRDELSVQDEIISRRPRVVILFSMRKETLNPIHRAHTGIESCRARDCAYWLNMNSEISDAISKCETCSTFQRKQTKEQLISQNIPDSPRSKTAADLLTCNQKEYLATVDYFSDFFEVDQITDKTGKQVITKLKGHFGRHGIPDTIITDTGPPFNSKDFADFASNYDFRHITSSPGYAQSK